MSKVGRLTIDRRDCFGGSGAASLEERELKNSILVTVQMFE